MDETTQNAPEWRTIGRSVIGASHARGGRPNQDALGWRPETGPGTTAMLAVADGLGGARCFRSERGARLAVETALEGLASLLDGQGDGAGDVSAVKRAAHESLPQTLVGRWRQRVDEDLAREPLPDADLDALGRAEGAASRKLLAEQPALAYGATLLAVAATPQFLLYVQIGAGDILSVSDEGDVTRPVAGDARLAGGETASLAAADAWKDFRVTFQTRAGAPPALILLSSEGYARSFPDGADFLKAGQDLHGLIAAGGLDAGADTLRTWLVEASREGSGDDVTLGIIARTDFERSAVAPAGEESAVRPAAPPAPDRAPDGLRTFSLRAPASPLPAPTHSHQHGSHQHGAHRHGSRRRPKRPDPRQRLVRLALIGVAALAVIAAAVALGVWAYRALHPPVRRRPPARVILKKPAPPPAVIPGQH